MDLLVTENVILESTCVISTIPIGYVGVLQFLAYTGEVCGSARQNEHYSVCFRSNVFPAITRFSMNLVAVGLKLASSP